MKIAYSKICINPSFPIKQRGFIQQVNPVYNFHDDLHARILAFDDGEKLAYHISLDILGFPVELLDSLKETLQSKSDRPISVTTSATHTHFSGDQKDARYQGELMTKLVYAVENLTFVESDSYKISYQCVPFEGVGTSRISNHKANVLLQLFTIYNEDVPVVGIILHNCHPTIHNGFTPYFTSEYPGYVIETLKRNHEDMDFTFIQGAAGDVSTRFTRPSQDYKGVIYLGNKLVDEVERLLACEKELKPLDKIEYDATYVPLTHEFNPIDISNLPEGLTDREIETIHVGAQVREGLAKRLHTLVKQVMISKLELGPYKIVFCPNEAFSSYIDCVDTTKAGLAGYSNGYSPYITGINDDFITYEKFTDTVTVEAKQRYMDVLRKYGK